MRHIMKVHCCFIFCRCTFLYVVSGRVPLPDGAEDHLPMCHMATNVTET